MLPVVIGAGVVGAGVTAGAVKVAREIQHFKTSGSSWISQGGTPHGTLYAKYLGVRNLAKWGVKNLLVHPKMTMITYKAEAEARTLENAWWHSGRTDFVTASGKAKPKIGYDNGPDAFRHTYASALIVYRLMTKTGVSAEKAQKFLDGAGNAHERDSWLHAAKLVNLPDSAPRYDIQKHSLYSSQMDIHNNELGRALGSELAAQHIAARQAGKGVDALTGETQLQQSVLDAIAGNEALPLERRAVVMDRVDAAPRPATAADIYTVQDGVVLRTADGKPQFATNPADATGYYSPITSDGTIDLAMPRTQLDGDSVMWPRESTPQS